VTIGFTAGVALIIFASRIKDLLGLRIAHEPAGFLEKLEAFRPALPPVSVAAIGLAESSLAFILILRVWKPRFPGFLAAIALGGLTVWALGSLLFMHRMAEIELLRKSPCGREAQAALRPFINPSANGGDAGTSDTTRRFRSPH